MISIVADTIQNVTTQDLTGDHNNNNHSNKDHNTTNSDILMDDNNNNSVDYLHDDTTTIVNGDGIVKLDVGVTIDFPNDDVVALPNWLHLINDTTNEKNNTAVSPLLVVLPTRSDDSMIVSFKIVVFDDNNNNNSNDIATKISDSAGAGKIIKFEEDISIISIVADTIQNITTSDLVGDHNNRSDNNHNTTNSDLFMNDDNYSVDYRHDSTAIATNAVVVVTAVVCNPGFLKSGESCRICPWGFWCEEGTIMVAQACPAGTASAVWGATTNKTCIPCAAYTPPGSTACRPCVAGFYCPSSLLMLPCPAHTVSPQGATSAMDCLCLSGYACKYGRRLTFTLFIRDDNMMKIIDNNDELGNALRQAIIITTTETNLASFFNESTLRIL